MSLGNECFEFISFYLRVNFSPSKSRYLVHIYKFAAGLDDVKSVLLAKYSSLLLRTIFMFEIYECILGSNF